MAKERKCPWCDEIVAEPLISRKKNAYVTVIERKCPKCNNVMAAYSEDEGDFLPKIRVFKD